jgi:regulation of enolase protein 1 (concanavalin A-like superfamily)
MLQMAAHRFRRNHLPYQSGGISIDDQNKFQIYDQTGQMMIQDYRQWIRAKKVEINSILAITSTGSLYGATAYTLLNTGG